MMTSCLVVRPSSTMHRYVTYVVTIMVYIAVAIKGYRFANGKVIIACMMLLDMMLVCYRHA